MFYFVLCLEIGQNLPNYRRLTSFWGLLTEWPPFSEKKISRKNSSLELLSEHPVTSKVECPRPPTHTIPVKHMNNSLPFMNCEKGRGVASLTVSGGHEFHFPHFSSNFHFFFLIFPQTFLIFVLILPFGWTTCSPGKALATPLGTAANIFSTLPWILLSAMDGRILFKKFNAMHWRQYYCVYGIDRLFISRQRRHLT